MGDYQQEPRARKYVSQSDQPGPCVTPGDLERAAIESRVGLLELEEAIVELEAATVVRSSTLMLYFLPRR